MATAQYYMPMPPAGTYQYQQSASYPSQQSYPPPQQDFYSSSQYQQPYPSQYLAPPSFPQQGPPYPVEGRAPPPPPAQAWPSVNPADHAGEYMGPGYKYGDYEDDTPDYNHPPEPQYGIPESKRSDPNFVFPEKTNLQRGQKPEGERGLGATMVGGAGGAFLGHKLEHGALGTIGGLALGAIAANAYEHHEKKKKEERRQSRAFDEGYEDGERDEQPHHHHHSRDVDDEGSYLDDRYEQEEEEYGPSHHHHHHHQYDDGYDEQDYGEQNYDRRDDY